MSNLVPYDPNRSTVDEFFAAVPYTTDWLTLLDRTKPNPNEMVAEIQKLEPQRPGDLRAHEVWIKQQLLRLALRRQKNKPLVGGTCGDCGSYLADPVLKICLRCAERQRQVGCSYGRGSCFFLEPAFDPQTNTWGLLYYVSEDDKFLLWLAKGYQTVQDAEMALYPAKCYSEWLERKYNGLYNDCRLLLMLFPLEVIVKLRGSLPYSPAAFTAHFKRAIFEHMQLDHSLLSWAIHRGLGDYHRNENE